MDELVNQVAEQTSISHDMAQKAVETVLDYMKEKLPAPIAGQIDFLLSGGGGLSGALGGMFGKE